MEKTRLGTQWFEGRAVHDTRILAANRQLKVGHGGNVPQRGCVPPFCRWHRGQRTSMAAGWLAEIVPGKLCATVAQCPACWHTG